MAAHTWEDLYRLIRKGSPPGIIYLFGSEEPLKHELVTLITDTVLDPATRDFNLDTRSAATLEPGDAASLLASLPMMSDRRLVIIRNIESWAKRAKARQAVISELPRLSDSTVLVLIAAAGHDSDPEILKYSYGVECARLTPSRAASWVTQRARSLGFSLQDEAAAHLVRIFDADLNHLDSELRKLSGIGGDTPLTVAQLSDLVGVGEGETAADWRDAVMNNQTARAATLLPSVLDQPGVSGVRLVSLLGQALVGVAMAKALRDSGKGGRALESAVFDNLKQARIWGLDYRTTAGQWAGWAEIWTLSRLETALAAALEADQALKGTSLSGDQGILTDLVMKLAKPNQRSAA